MPRTLPNAYGNIAPVMLNHNLMPTVDTALAPYTKREVAQARLAQEQMNILGWPTQKDHDDMIAHNTLHNSPAMLADIRQSYDKFGPPVPALQGKSKHCKPDPVPNTTLAQIPRALYYNIRNVTISMDFLSVGSVPFFVAKSLKIK